MIVDSNAEKIDRGFNSVNKIVPACSTVSKIAAGNRAETIVLFEKLKLPDVYHVNPSLIHLNTVKINTVKG